MFSFDDKKAFELYVTMLLNEWEDKQTLVDLLTSKIPIIGDAASAIGGQFNRASEAYDYANSGGTLYRSGEFGHSVLSEAQYWATESPLSPGYASKYGLTTNTADYIVGGRLNTWSNFITRSSPGYANNLGGAIEVVTNPGGVKLNFFHMPD